jgi:phosphinothricin acetyltransferase
MTMLFTIRDMRDDDWTRVSEIYQQALLEGISTFATGCPTFEEWDTAHLKDCRYVMLADDMVIGWCAVSPTSSREAYKGVVEVSIYFDKAFRGMGLGTKLLDHLCRESEAKGYWCLFVNILSINTASINLHKKCGFREVGYRERIAKDLFGVWQNTVVMERRNGIS